MSRVNQDNFSVSWSLVLFLVSASRGHVVREGHVDGVFDGIAE